MSVSPFHINTLVINLFHHTFTLPNTATSSIRLNTRWRRRWRGSAGLAWGNRRPHHMVQPCSRRRQVCGQPVPVSSSGCRSSVGMTVLYKWDLEQWGAVCWQGLGDDFASAPVLIHKKMAVKGRVWPWWCGNGSWCSDDRIVLSIKGWM